MEPTQHKSNGALMGAIIIIIILIIAGIYLLKNNVVQEENSNTEDSATTLENQNGSTSQDSISDIETDLEMNADIDSLDKGLE